MDQQSLHPNLARLAAAYDEICSRWGRNELTGVDARGQIAALVARDDNGLQWMINPSDGSWQYRTRTGEWRAGDPPTYGYATPTPFELARGSRSFDPDTRVSFHEVNEDLLFSPGSLAGSTRRPEATAPRTLKDRLLSENGKRILLALAALLVLWVAYSLFWPAADPATPAPVDGASVTVPVEEVPAPPAP